MAVKLYYEYILNQILKFNNKKNNVFVRTKKIVAF